MSGAEFGRKLQEDILNGKEDDEVKKNTGETVKALMQLVELAKKGGNQMARAVLSGP
jgi:hypothetical protein